jgi:hypothetical protein
MPDLDLIDRLVATYRILIHTVRQRPEAGLDGGEGSPRTIIRNLRNDELHFSQNLKARISGQAVGLPDSTEGQRDVGTAGLQSTTAELIAQFGTARESTLAMLRSLPDEQWDETGDHPRSIRTEVFDLVARDRQVLEQLGKVLGESLTEYAPA